MDWKLNLGNPLNREAMLVLYLFTARIAEWGETFGDSVIATAILDGRLHPKHVHTTRGSSHLLRQKSLRSSAAFLRGGIELIW